MRLKHTHTQSQHGSVPLEPIGSDSALAVDLHHGAHTLPAFVENARLAVRRDLHGEKTTSQQHSAAFVRCVTSNWGNRRICTNVVTSSRSEREFLFPFRSVPLGPLFRSKECTYDFWFHTNSTWSLSWKNNKYGKHLIQNNMFIQRPVDLRRNGPPLLWSAASVCV